MLAIADWTFWFNLAVGIFFAWVGIYFTLRKKYPGQLSFLKEKPIRLFDDIARNIPDLEIQYQKIPIQQNLVVMRGYILNTGRKDISPEMIDAPLRVRIAQDCSWLEAKILHGNGGTASAKIINPTTIEIQFGLFRCDEYLRLESLISQPHGETPLALTFSHRIADTASMRFSPMPTIQQSKLPGEMWLMVCLLCGFYAGLVARLYRPAWFSTATLQVLTVMSGLVTVFILPALFLIRKNCNTRRLLKLTE